MLACFVPKTGAEILQTLQICPSRIFTPGEIGFRPLAGAQALKASPANRAWPRHRCDLCYSALLLEDPRPTVVSPCRGYPHAINSPTARAMNLTVDELADASRVDTRWPVEHPRCDACESENGEGVLVVQSLDVCSTRWLITDAQA